MNCLQIIQTVCKRIGITSPTAAVTSTDWQIQQILSLVEEEGQEQATRFAWQALRGEATFTTVATEVQSTLAAITTGFDYIVNDTIWNRSLRRPVYGPKIVQDWQQAKASQITGPFNSFRIFSDAIYFNPVPSAGDECYFEYQSKNWVSTSLGGTDEVWTNDDDTAKLSDQLLVLGAVWRWKQAKGLDYAEDYAKYERRVNDAFARDAGKPVLDMSGARYEIQPAIVVSSGSWNV